MTNDNNKYFFDSKYFESYEKCLELAKASICATRVFNLADGVFIGKDHGKTVNFLSEMEKACGLSNGECLRQVLEVLKSSDRLRLCEPDEYYGQHYFCVKAKVYVNFKTSQKDVKKKVYVKLFNVFKGRNPWLYSERGIDTTGKIYIDMHEI